MDIAPWLLGFVLFLALLGATGQLFLKQGADNLEFNVKSLFANWKLVLGISLYIVSAALWILALRHGNLSVMYPIIATSYIWVAFFSIWFLKETVTPFKWMGIALIVIGVAFIVR